MKVIFVLIRHATTDFTATTLLGRNDGIALNAEGKSQAHDLVTRLEALRIDAVFSSPIQRAVETAQPLARDHGVDVQRASGVTEVNCGHWTGRTFSELEKDPVWRRFNAFRSDTQAPGGEHMLDVQKRVVQQLQCWRESRCGQVIAVVSHADVIRAALCHYLGMPVDLMLRIEISPASVSVLSIDDWGARVSRINDTGERWHSL